MRKPNEHDDDLEPQVVDASETETGIETETFLDTDDVDGTGVDSKTPQGSEATPNPEAEAQNDEAADSL